MSATNHTFVRRLACMMPLVGVVLAIPAVRRAMQLPECEVKQPKAVSLTWPATIPCDLDWELIQHRGGGVAPRSLGTLAKRFRLAGTFIVIDTDVRKAILDDLAKGGVQLIVGEGAPIEGGVEVVRILQRQVTLRGPGGEEHLWLSFSNQLAKASHQGTAGTGTEGTDVAQDAGYNEFGGKRVGENRWLFRREVLEEYYQELLDEPDRLLRVFDSLKPVWTPDRQINGYRLGVEGEGDFFAAVGLQEGDHVLAVNQMKMTNRRRAEHFIREFVNRRASAFVLDIERKGKKEKLIYQVR